MKIKLKELTLTKEQEHAPLHKTIFVTKSTESFEKSSLWRKYRIIKQNDTTFKVEEISCDISFGLPVIVGGNGFIHSVWFWKEEDQWIGYKPYTSYEDALKSVNDSIAWTTDWEKEEAVKKIEVFGREIVSVHP